MVKKPKKLRVLRGLEVRSLNSKHVRGGVCFVVRPRTDAANPDFPVWHPMDGGAAITGRQAIIAHLQGLRAGGVAGPPPAQATLVGVADHGNKSITLDVTLGGPEGSHACADKVEFDESGCIKVFWHCSTDTHENGHAGHPLTPDGEPHEHT